jgi:hypothetical protein
MLGGGLLVDPPPVPNWTLVATARVAWPSWHMQITAMVFIMRNILRTYYMTKSHAPLYVTSRRLLPGLYAVANKHPMHSARLRSTSTGNYSKPPSVTIITNFQYYLFDYPYHLRYMTCHYWNVLHPPASLSLCPKAPATASTLRCRSLHAEFASDFSQTWSLDTCIEI